MDTVPSIVGQTQAAAGVILSVAGLAVGAITSAMSSTVPQFNVISQDPAAGTLVPPGSAVNFVISSGSVQSYQVPDLTGLTQTQATSALTGAGLTLGTATPVLSPTAYAFSVVSQNPTAGSQVSAGTPVNVQFSAGSHLIQVPNEVGVVEDYALQAIVGAEFEVAVSRQASTTVPDGYVISQDPAGSALALLSSPVNLVVSSGGPVIAAVPNVDVTSGGIQYLDEAALYQAGFAIGSVTTQPSPSALVSNRAALSQNPAPGTLAAWDTSVSMVKAWGDLVRVTIPNVIGMTLQAAITAIYNAPLPLDLQGDSTTYSFTTQSSATVPAGVVISQNPPAGPATIEADPGQFNTVFAPVALVVSSGPLVVPSYSYLSQFGEAGNQQGQFQAAIGLAIDPVSRNIVVSDSHGRVQIFDANGGFRSYFGGQGATTAGPGADWANRFPGDGTGDGLFIGRADAIAIDPINHNIVVVDELGDRVMIFNSAGQFQSVFGSLGSAPGQFSFDYIYPTGVAIDPTSENIVVADNGNSRVQIFNSAGVYLSQFGTLLNQNSQFSGEPSGVAIDPVSHNIVVADLLDACLQIFNSDGVYLSRFGTYGSGNGQFDEPLAVAIDPVSRNIVVTDRGSVNSASAYGINQRVQIFDSTGVFLSQFGGAGGGNGQFGAVGYSGPLGIAIDPVSHNILVTDNSPDNLVQSRVEIFALPAGATTTTVVASLNPATVGQYVTFTATVTGSSPTGTVQFMDGSSSLGAPVALTGNAAALTLSTLSAGAHSITAVYSGDSSNSANTSAILSEVVNLTAMTPAIASSLNPATAGQSVTFTSTVPGNSPTGTVQFMDGGISLGAPVALTGGAASLPFSRLSVGTHAITAVYSGDSSNAAGSSPILNEVVSAAATAPVVTAPAPVTIPATQAAGATSSASPALAAFLAGAAAVESISPPPVQLPPQIGGVPVSNTTLFPVGTTTITFIFKDSNGNFGSATSTVTVAIGTPGITGSTVGVGTDPSGAIYVNVVLTNTGTGNARNLNISTLTLGTPSGTGTVTYNTQLSPALPMLVINNLDVGNKVAVRLYLNVLGTATLISITESGPVQDVLGNNYNYSTAETASTGKGNRCDVNQDGVVNVLDAQIMVNEGLGAIPANNDLNQDGVVNVVDIQIDINAALGLGCSAQ